MIPKWKLRREVDRLATQVKALPQILYEPIVQRRFDASRDQAIKVTEGAVDQSSRLAIFLIYQPKGICRSILKTCDHLVASGFAPVVVSNTPLDGADLKALGEVAHLVAERPNFGYDFGGYRDGVWLINSRGVEHCDVLFLNDSVWFPVFPESTLLNDMYAHSESYVGTQVFGDIARAGKRRGFFGSYCFLVKQPVWDSSLFQSFWSNYRVSSNKEVTLRRGERTLSRQLLGGGYPSIGLYGIERFTALVDALSEDALQEALRDMVVTDPRLVEERERLMETEPGSRNPEAIRALVHASAKSKNYIAAAPVLSIRELRFPMIKKNQERHYVLARHRIVRAIDEGRLTGLDPEIVAEIRLADSKSKILEQ